MNALGRAPVTIVTGFLGSGKTTLLNRLLTSGAAGRVAALVNDFGAIDIDAALVSSVAGDVVQLSNGCVCCTINSDLYNAANQVLALDPPVDRIVVETTGLADPLPVGLTFLQTDLRERTNLDAVITVVDCANFALDLFKADAAMAQIVHGDIIILNKTDLVSQAAVESLEARIGALKRRARFLRSVHGQIPFALVLDIPEGAANLDATRKPAHTHAAEREQFQAFSFELSAPISAERFQTWLDSSLPAGLYRAKGLVRFDSSPDTFVFQLCGARASYDVFDQPLDASRLVFIGRGIDRESLAKDLDWCLAGRHETSAMIGSKF